MVALNTEDSTSGSAGMININCARIATPSFMQSESNGASDQPLVVLENEKIPINIDASGCDESMIDPAQPWTFMLLDKTYNPISPVVFADLLEPGRSVYMWTVQDPHNRNIVAFDPSADIHGGNMDTGVDAEYYIEVQVVSKDSHSRLIGNTNSFIIRREALRKRENPSSSESSPVLTSYNTAEPSANILNKHVIVLESPNVPPDQTTANTPVEGSIQPVTTVDQVPNLSAIPETLTTPPLGTEDSILAPHPLSAKPVGGIVDTAVPAAADVRTFSDVSRDEVPSPTYPNTPIDVPEVFKKESPTSVFLKYTALGTSFLAAVGTGVGGIVGGVVGGALGLVLGLIIAGFANAY
ncbi:hypothetical protein BGX28_001873 [Mortierella sp. GBA30]|nr:hypothetical protein BGX28_001873 [Mortierella sp. GBA30]